MEGFLRRRGMAPRGGEAMRRVMYGAACTLDGFIADLQHGVEWLRWSDDVSAISQASLRDADTLVMGRKTYDASRRMGSGPHAGFRNVIFSKTLGAGSVPGAEVIGEDAVAVVKRMRADEGAGICVLGGGELGAALLDADLIDEVGVNIHPLLLGRGIPMFPGRRRSLDLELIEGRAIQYGCIHALYRVVRSGSR
jgi:dihydrofolate reductase